MQKFTLGILLALVTSAAYGQATTFTYQGQLKDGGIPANGSYNLVFKLFNSASGGTQIGSTITRNDVVLNNGLFNEGLDFGAAAFTGQPRWLEITANGVVLNPRQTLTATPYALYALNSPGGSSSWQPLGSNIYNLNTGNVGIGTENVTHRLTVSSPDQETMRLLRSTTGWGEGARLNFGDSDYAFIEEDVDDKLNIQANRVSLWTGLVGIGELNPLAALHVESWMASDGNNTAVFEAPGLGPNASHIHYGLNGDWYVRSANAAGKVVLQDTGGSVGIGTSAPSYPLTIKTSTSPFASGYGWVHTDGVRELGSYVSDSGGWLGTRSNHPLHFFTSDSSPRVTISTAGKMGVGTQAPVCPVHAVSVENNVSAIYGTVNSGTANAGVYGASTAAHGNGLIGEAHFGSSAYGVWGRSTEGIGVYGSTNVGQSENIAGVVGRNFAYEGSGVIGDAPNEGFGVLGRAVGGVGYGVWGVGSAAGVVGHTIDPDNYYAVYAIGSVGASGNKDFRIDHPRDPENKYLHHHCAEGPEPLNIYRGTVQLDSSGEAWVTLPDYFEDINKDFTYVLTAVGAAMPNLHVAEEVTDNQFQISGGLSGGKVCWEVKGMRNDLFVRRYGAKVEVNKPEHERGKYQHPELYGKPAELAIHYRATAQTTQTDLVKE